MKQVHQCRHLSSRVWLHKVWVALAVLALSSGALANNKVVWHCSKHQTLNMGTEAPLLNADDTLFFLSSFSSNTISISLNDLADVYKGRRVVLGQQVLTGCFLAGEQALNQAAFDSIGLRWTTLQLMNRRSSIANSPLFMVNNESDMMACIANNYPAVGYLSQSQDNEQVGPCF